MSPARGKATSHIVAGKVEKVMPNGYEFVVDGEKVKVTNAEFCREEEGCVCADHYDVPDIGTLVRLRVGDQSGRITAVEDPRKGHAKDGETPAAAPPSAGAPDPDRVSRADLFRARVEVVIAASNFEGDPGGIGSRADRMWAWVTQKAPPAAAAPRNGGPGAHTAPTAAGAPAEGTTTPEEFYATVLAAFDGNEAMAGTWLASEMEIQTPGEQVRLTHLKAWLRSRGHTIADLEARLDQDEDVPFS